MWPEMEIVLRKALAARVTDECRRLGQHGGQVARVLRNRSRRDYDGPGIILSTSGARHKVEALSFSGEACVLKRFELASGFDDRAFLREVALHIRLQHHNILELKEWPQSALSWPVFEVVIGTGWT
mmetsp:Transcript_22840/g.73826  ORF Transcript_22840/g.73826 Transcript_22840/m.73826 type:complete len:126 (+) Transcript_22840:1590-1967(+)